MKLSGKVLVANLLTSNFIGRIIKTLSGGKLKSNGVIINIKSPKVTLKTVGLIFWKFYESSEIRFIKKYMRSDLPVIELGTSLGIIACFSRQINKQKLICVEANNDLIPVIQENFKLNNVQNYQLINAAIGDESTPLYFEKGKMNTQGKLIDIQTPSSTIVYMTNLSAILKKFQIKDFVLISDIEGAEYFLLLNDAEAIKNCRQMIIETHQMKLSDKLVTSDDIKNMIIDMGFILKDSYGPNYVFERPISN